jgi:mono/diheme cytochrome c family protein
MPITVACTCGKRFQFEDAQVGKKFKCSNPACRRRFIVPAPNPTIHLPIPDPSIVETAPLGGIPPHMLPYGFQAPGGSGQAQPVGGRSHIWAILAVVLTVGVIGASVYFARKAWYGGGRHKEKPPPEAPTAELARKAQNVLSTHCQKCHGQDGKVKGGFGYATDLAQLVSRGKVIPGDSAASPLFQRITDADDPMPPREAKVRPTPEEVEILRRWIDAGAPAAEGGGRTFIADADILRAIHDDLFKNVEEKVRPFTRYFTLTHLHNANLPEEQLQLARAGLSKLLNSVSWGPRVVAPRAIDPAKTVFRIDLRDYADRDNNPWKDSVWKKIVASYPYGQAVNSRLAAEVNAATESDQPVIRGDWFVARASHPPLYHDLLGLPETDAELERALRVDVARNIADGLALRAGFNGSGVSGHNRLIERHRSPFGAYWKSYDFADDAGAHNLFSHPLGPKGPDAFQHAGGEIIFNLPNGMQGYLLVTADGKRIPVGPLSIVSDPRRPDKAVINGVSCMSCHVKGMIDKADQVRLTVDQNEKAYKPEVVRAVRDLYPPKEAVAEALRDDRDRFLAALKKAGVDPEGKEPVVELVELFERELDLPLAAAEVGIRPNEFRERLEKREPQLMATFGPLRSGNTVKRQVFEASYQELVKQLRVAEVQADAAQGEAKESRFTGHGAPVSAAAFSPDGKSVLSASASDGLRLWEAANGQELRRFRAGGSDAAFCVAFVGPEGKFAVSGHDDKVLRLWDVKGGNEVRTFRGHSNYVLCLSVSQDGHKLVSGGSDKAVILWNVDTGKEEKRFTGHDGSVFAVALAPDGKHILSGSVDGTVRLWDIATGKARVFKGHSNAVTSVAFSPDGKRAVSGGWDQAVILWNVETGQEERRFEGHKNPVNAVAFAPDGRHVLSGSDDRTVRLWDILSGKAAVFEGHTGPVQGVAIAPSGRQAATASADGTVRIWNLPG